MNSASVNHFRKRSNNYREYQLSHSEDRAAEANCDYAGQVGQNPTLFVFPYDWRRSNGVDDPNAADTAKRLAGFVRCIRRFYPNSQVDILAHSMGGLVAQRYLLSNPGGVSNFITVAAPWLGAPKAIATLEKGTFLDQENRYLLIRDTTVRDISRTFPGVHELLPSRWYYELSREKPLAFEGRLIPTYDEFVSFMDGRFSTAPGSTGRAFHDRAGQDDARNNPQSVKYYHVYGQRPHPDTIRLVSLTRVLKCGHFLADCKYEIEAIPRFTYGDRTVPKTSAERCATSSAYNVNERCGGPPATDLNENNAVHRTFTVDPSNSCLTDPSAVDHTGMTQSCAVQNYILSILNNTSPPPSAAAQAAETTAAQAYFLRVDGTTSFNIEDAGGRSANPFSLPPDASMPWLSTYVVGTKAAVAVMPTDQTYTVTLQADGDPIVVELTKGTDIETTEAVRYLDVSLPANVRARLAITPQGVGPLQYDNNGDGTYESEVPPTAKVSGAAAQDTEPPSVEVGAVIQGSNNLVTVNSSDSGSGVKATYYSLDGTNFQPYSSPLVIDPRQFPVVYAFADDNVANRSGLVSYVLPIPEPTPTPTPAPSSFSSASGSGVFNGTATLTATLTSGSSPLSGKTVSFTLGSTSVGNATTDASGVATLTGVSTVGVNAGTHANAVGVSFAGDANFTGSSGMGTLLVGKATQTITFGSLPNKTFGDSDFGLSATASSGLPVSFSGAGNCAVSGSSVHLTGAGPCTIKASQAGDSNYNAAADVSRTFTTGKVTQAITFPALTNKTYGDPDFQISATASSGLGVSFEAAGQCAVSGGTVHVTGAGSCTVTASQAGNADYQAAPDASRGFTIVKAGSVTTVTVSNAVYDGQPHGATATVAGAAGFSQSLTVTYTGRNATAYGPSAGAPINAGDYTASATLTGDPNHAGSSDSKDFNIAKAAQTITFGALSDRTFGDADFTVGATASSGLAVNLVAAGQCSLTGSNVHLTGAGSCTITASQSGDKNYDSAAAVSQSFQIGRAATAASVSSSVNPSAFNQGVTFTATITSATSTPTGSVHFKADGDSMGGSVNCMAGTGNSCVARLSTSALSAGAHTIGAEYGGDSNFGASSGGLAGGQAVGGILEFSQPLYTASERDGSVTIAVRRTGDAGSALRVNFLTDDGGSQSAPAPCPSANGLALERCDYTRAAGTLEFAASETERSFVVLVNDDAYSEGNETTLLRLSAPGIGASLGLRSTATLRILDNAPAPQENPVADSGFFVRQHYHDFLNREPDAGGLAFWTDGIESCGGDQQCRALKRIDTSAAFFLSIEFQETGFLVQRMYKAAYGDAQGQAVINDVPTPIPVPVIRLDEFLADTQRIGSGVIVGTPGWPAQLAANKAAFAQEFAASPRFTAAFDGMSPEQFVDALNTNAGDVLSAAEKANLVAELSANNTPAGRASVLSKVAEDSDLAAAELNKAFVLMQYFGYLRRNPNDLPDTDHSGYNFWLTKLNQFNGDFRQAQMVFAFIDSIEYRQRFGH